MTDHQNVRILTSEYLDHITATPEVLRVGILAPLENGEPKLHKRWSAPFAERGQEVVVIPVGSPHLKDVVPYLDGFHAIGGDAHVHPSRWGGDAVEDDDKYDVQRDEYTYDAIDLCFNADKPFVAVCLSMQHMVAAYGGRVERLPIDEEHEIDHGLGYKLAPLVDNERCLQALDSPIHTMTIQGGGLLNDIFNGRALFQVNSIHEYGMTLDQWLEDGNERLREAFKIEALAPDGAVEAVSAIDKRFFLGVQYHLELPGFQHDSVYNRFFEEIEAHHLERTV